MIDEDFRDMDSDMLEDEADILLAGADLDDEDELDPLKTGLIDDDEDEEGLMDDELDLMDDEDDDELQEEMM